LSNTVNINQNTKLRLTGKNRNENFHNQSSFSDFNSNKSSKVISIIDNQISKVLVGSMPDNRHIASARETLRLMIDSLPEDITIYPFLLEQIQVSYQFNANIKNDKLVPKVSFYWNSFSPFTLPYFKGGTYLFIQSISK